jgi:hypothetical protein
MMARYLSKIRKLFHKHSFQTTHVNGYGHPMKQVCTCGVSRTFEWKVDKDEIKGMPWEKGEWLHSDGNKTIYNILD